MDLLTAFSAIAIVNVLAWITPGPNMVAVMAAALEHGRGHGIATGLGLATAALFWALLSVLGVAMLFDSFPTAVLALKLAGSGYLVYLGWKSLRSAMVVQGALAVAGAAARRVGQSFRTGFLVSLTNPKAALFFTSIMTAFIPASAPHWFLALVVGFCGAVAAALHAVTATVFSSSLALRVLSRARRALSGVFGIAFIAIGGAVAMAALRR